MAAQALYRKWRSRTFEEVIAQEHVTRTLGNALRDGRVAHAYLFTGPRGTGKTSTARLLAKAVNCLSTGEAKPCNACAICQAIDEGRMLDLIEIDAASNRGIDEIRDLRDKVNFRPGEARYKFYIIDEVHMLTNEAFNALLKTLEEPPPHVIFVLATTEPHKIPATVLSRCQRFDFRRIPLSEILSRLSYIATEEHLVVEPQALELIARQATGSMRDAVSLLDQMTAYGGEQITLAHVQEALGIASSQLVADLVDCLAQGNTSAGLEMINRAIDEGADPRQLAREMVEHLHGLMLLQAGSGGRLLDLPAEAVKRMKGQAETFSPARLRAALQRFNQASQDVKIGFLPQLPLELAFFESATEEAARPQPQPPKEQPKPQPPVTAQPKAAPAPTPPTEQPAPVEAEKEAPPATPARSELTLDYVKANWNAVFSELKQQGESATGAFLSLSTGKLVKVEDCTIVFATHSFNKGKIENPQKKALIEQAISRVMGRVCYLRCVLPEEQSAQDSPPEQEKREAAPPVSGQTNQPEKAGESQSLPLEEDNQKIIEHLESRGAKVKITVLKKGQ